MSAKKIVVVFGATGNQGGSVIKSILGDPKAASQFQIRGVTRDTSKPAAKALVEKGCEVVTADLNDEASLKDAFKNAYAVFAVTNYWEKLDAAYEYQQGKNIADASKHSGVKHLVWSTLFNISKISGGKLTKVAHFDAKAKVSDYIAEQGIPHTLFMPGVFMSNYPSQAIVRDPQAGKYVLALPVPTSTPSPLLAAETDTGKFVKAILLKPEQTLGKTIYAATDYYTNEQIIETFREVKPVDAKDATALQVPGEVYMGFLAKAGMPRPVQEELLENWLLNESPGYYNGGSLKESHAILDEPLVTLKEYFATTKVWADLK